VNDGIDAFAALFNTRHPIVVVEHVLRPMDEPLRALALRCCAGAAPSRSDPPSRPLQLLKGP